MDKNEQVVRRIESALGMIGWCPYCVTGRLLDDDNCDPCKGDSDDNICSLLEISMLELR